MDAVAFINIFWKNEQTRKVFWTLFISMAGLVLARIIDPGTARQFELAMTGMGV